MIDLFTSQIGRLCNIYSGYTLLHLVFRIQINEMKHDLGKSRIKLGPATLDQFLSHDMLWDCITVAPVRCHGVIGICHGDDPRDLGDGFTFESFGVAPSVISLVVIARAYRDPRGLLDVGEDFTAHDGMLLDLSEFLVRQLALLLEELNWDANLAYIVK